MAVVRIPIEKSARMSQHFTQTAGLPGYGLLVTNRPHSHGERHITVLIRIAEIS